MALELSFLVNDKATPEIKRLQEQLKKLKPVINDTDKGFIGLNKATIATTASIYLLSKAFKKVLTDGMEYNKQIEQSRAGLIALSVAVQDKAIPVSERYNKAQLESIETLKELQK